MAKQARLSFDKDIAKFEPRQTNLVNAWDSGKYKFILYGGALGGGKLLRLSTPIATPTGWTTIGDIQIGDRVFDECGMVCNVVAVSKPEKDKTYLLTFSDGSEIVCGASHEWLTETDRDRKLSNRRSDSYREKRKETRSKTGKGIRPDLSEKNSNREYEYLTSPINTVKTTQEIADTIKSGLQTNHAILVSSPLALPEAELPVDPYVFGAWLGDGTSINGNITGIDEDIFDYIRSSGYEVTQHAQIMSHCVLGLKTKLATLGVLNNKFIPMTYLRSSIPQRVALLQGLMDTDGTCDLRGQCEIQLTNKTLIDGVYELICSLGIKVQMRTGRAKLYGKDCGPKYRLKFIANIPAFKLRRKLERQKQENFRGTHERRYIVSATEIESEVMKCIEVDSPSRLYLVGRAIIPTHNSYLLRWFAARYLMKVFLEKGLTWVTVMLACENYPSLKDRQLQKIAQEFPDWLGRNYADHRDYGRCFILSPEYGNGVIVFRNLDDPAKYASSEFAAILVDELTKNAYDVFTFLRTRLRWPGIPDMECPFIGGTNPGSVGHGWCKALWMDKIFGDEWAPDNDEPDYRKAFLYVPSKASDNKYIDKTYLNTLKTLPESIRRAFMDGDWNVFIGQAFQEWNESLHVLKEAIPVPDGAPIIMTYDEGFGAPFSVCWWWVDADNRIYLFDEWYGWSGTPNQGLRMAASDVARGIVLREQNAGIWGKVTLRLAGGDTFQKKPNWQGGGQGPSTAEVFRDNGLTMTPGDPNRRVKIMQFHERLRYTPGQMPMMMIYPNCKQFIRTIPNLVMDENNIEDIDDKGEDHIYDSAALICLARPLGNVVIEEEPKKEPQDITEVAALERKEIFEAFEETEGEYAYW